MLSLDVLEAMALQIMYHVPHDCVDTLLWTFQYKEPSSKDVPRVVVV